MDAVFLLKPVGRNGAADAGSFHEKIQTIATTAGFDRRAPENPGYPQG
jgi:hypothetical protein